MASICISLPQIGDHTRTHQRSNIPQLLITLVLDRAFPKWFVNGEDLQHIDFSFSIYIICIKSIFRKSDLYQIPHNLVDLLL